MLYSHIFEDGQKLDLYKHLKDVGEKNHRIINGKNINFSIDKTIIADLSYIIGICHDFGKATSFFQNDRLIQGIKNDKTNHSKLSAVWSYNIINDYINKINLPFELRDFLKLISVYIIERHHSLLDNLENLISLDEKDYILKEQFNNLNKEIFSYQFRHNNIEVDFSKYKSFDIDSIISDIKINYFKFEEFIKEDLEKYILFLLLFSVLMESDKCRLILGETEISEKLIQINKNKVDTFKKEIKAQFKINTLREEAYQSIITQIDNSFDLTKKIYSINLPTGLGKTLTSLSFALKLREKIKNNYKLIYSLPYLSIIEQTDEVFNKVFEKEINDYGNYFLIKHHSLSDLKYKTGKNNNFDESDINKSEFLFNIWNSEIVITTFDQVLYSIFSRNRSFIMRFHKLFNSIIIFDEVQSFPVDLWLLVKKFFLRFVEIADSYIILMSATKPLIFNEEKQEIKELVPDVRYYFNKLDRISLKLNITEEISINDFKDFIKNIISSNKGKDIIIVMNTIDSSIEIYNFLLKIKESVNFSNELIYLSSNIIPLHRKQRIEKIKDNMKNKKIKNIIVSTQCIEAGVDIDADIIIRDFGPLDSINQICGRCNRNYNKPMKGQVFIFKINDNNNRLYSQIYDNKLREITQEVLEKTTYLEKNFYNINNKYFRIVNERFYKGVEGKKILNNIYKFHLSELNIQKILRGNQIKEKVFIKIEKDPDNINIFNKMKNILYEKNFLKKRTALLNIRGEINNYSINLYRQITREKIKYITSDFISEDNGIKYIDSIYYDDEIGFKPENTVFCD